MPRTSTLERKTKETSISVELNIDGSGNGRCGKPFAGG